MQIMVIRHIATICNAAAAAKAFGISSRTHCHISVNLPSITAILNVL